MTLKNVTHGPGLLPIHLGPAKLQNSQHTLVHYFDISTISTEIDNLENHYNTLTSTIKEHNQSGNIDNYDKLYRHIYKRVRDKLINLHPRGHYRNKRGLIDGLGTAIKFVTGNMDANDAHRINNILKHLQNNQNTIQEQIRNQYSINNNLIRQFNFTIQNVQYNQIQLKNKILQLGKYVATNSEEISILQIKDLYNQLILTYNTILDLLTEIENSLTFCTLGVIHPSIIKVPDLMSGLLQLIPFFKDQLPFPVNADNMLNYQSIMNVHCQQNKDKIIYFLTIPLEYNIQFELYYLQSVPTLVKGEYFTIIPNFKYLLTNQGSIKPLLDICSTNGMYHCPSKLITTANTTCEANIINGTSTKGCLYTQITTNQNHLELIQHTNQYLGWFTTDSNMEVRCPEEKRILRPLGIFLMKTSGNCDISFNGKILKKNILTVNTPTMVDFQMPQETEVVPKTNLSIELKTLNFKEIPEYQIKPLIQSDFDIKHIYTPSIWTIIIYISIILTITTIIVKRLKRETRPKEPPVPKQVTKNANPLQQPSEVSF